MQNLSNYGETLNTNQNFDPFYSFSDVPDGVPIPEYERLHLADEYVRRLLYDIPSRDKRSLETMWHMFQQWNETTAKLPYPKDESLRPTFDALVESRVQTKIVDDAVDAEDKSGKGQSQSTRLVDMVLHNPKVTLFKDEYGEACVRIPIAGHDEIWPCKSAAFTRWLGSEFYKLTQGKTVPGRESIKDAIGLFEGRAINEGEEHQLFNRVARTPDALWYDLADKDWRAVRITKEGWSVETSTPLLFRRFSHLGAQVEPTRGGRVQDVLPFVNVTDPDQQMLFMVHLVAGFIPGWPHPALYVYGPQGSAKSTLSRIDRKLLDPSKIEIVSLTRHEGDLAQQLSHHHHLSFDNVSELPHWIADLLCRAITGSGFSKRELYTNDDDVIRYVMANLGLNGINIASSRADLLERCLLLKLERMDKSDRKQEYELMSAFEAARSRILGGIFDAVSRAMTLVSTVQLDELPRMADFTRWGCAIAEALEEGGQQRFLRAYLQNVNSQSEVVVNDNTTAMLVMKILETHGGYWVGMPDELFKLFKDTAMTEMIVDRELPGSASALMRELNRLKTAFEEMGYEISSNSDRLVTLKKASI